MALQIWLPLNKSGDLSNKGLADVTVTNNGATYNSNGKIGGCYTGFNTGFMTLNKEAMSTLSGEFTISCWIKINSYNSNYQTVWSGCSTSSSWNNMIMVLLRNGSRSNLIFCISNNSSATEAACSAGTIELGNWMHITCCYKPGHIITYKNGILVLDYSTSIVPNVSTIKSCLIGRDYGSYPNDMNINDFRIYDHCLSPKEVTELSKGLVLHYPLNNTQVLNNCFENPTFNTSASSGGWHHWGPSGYSATYSLNTDKQFIYNKTQTYSHKVSNTGSTYYICHQSPAFDGGYRSAQAIIKMSDGSNPTGKVVFGHNANVGTNTPNTFHHLGDGFYLMRHEGFRQDGSDNLVSISVLAGYTVYISEAYLENNRTVCSDLFQGNIVYDESGYGNNGTITGTLINSTNTPKYDKCTNFQSNSCITTNNSINGKVSIITVSAWAKRDSWTGDWRIISCAQGGGWTIYPYNDKICWLPKISGEYRYIYSLLSLSQISAEWHHFVATWDGNNAKLYIDGELLNTVTVSNGELQYYTSNAIFIGAEAASDLTTPQGSYFNGLISDVRIYATALSADDIKELYNTAAFVDHKGNIGCYLFYEDADSQITKTGQIRTEEFEEISDLSDGVAKVYEQKIECNQLIEI